MRRGAKRNADAPARRGSRKTSSPPRGNRRGSSAMRGDGDSGKEQTNRRLKKGVLTPDEAKSMVKKMRENAGEGYYDVSRLDDQDRIIIFDIPEDPTETTGTDGRPYVNLVPKKIVEIENGDVSNVYHDTSLKAPTMILKAVYGDDDNDPQVEDDHIFMSYSDWRPAKSSSNSKNYHKVLWASEGPGGTYDKVYSSVD